MTSPEKEKQLIGTGPMHAVDILAFIEAQEIPSLYFETPYTLSPAPGGEYLYALLRETLRSTRKIGIAYVVIHTRQHLAALVPQGQSLVLNTLRWGSEEDDAELADAQEIEDSAAAARDSATAIRPGLPAPAEHNMKAKKSTGILVQELNSLLDEDDPVDEDYFQFSPRKHPSPQVCARHGGIRPYQRMNPRQRPRSRR